MKRRGYLINYPACRRLFLSLILLFSLGAIDYRAVLGEAHEAYLEGVSSGTIAARREALNRAVRHYESIAKEAGSAQLYYNLASCYAQLEEWPWAVYYYAEAMRFAPRDRAIVTQLNRARAKLSLSPIRTNLPLSQQEVTLCFGLSVAILLVMGSLTIWRPSSLTLSGGCFALLVAVGGALLYLNQPMTGVVIEPVRMEGGVVPAGTFAKIKSDRGEFVEVVIEGGKRGEISATSLRTLFP